MQRIDSVDGQFHEGNPATGQKGTKVTAGFLNGLQEELANVVEATGVELDPEADDQLLKALKSGKLQDVIFASQYPTLAEADAAAGAAGHVLIISTQWNVVPATLAASVVVIEGGIINNAGPLAIQGSFSSSLHHVFIGAGAVTFPEKCRPALEWFGVKADGTDQLAKVNKAIASVNSSSASSLHTKIMGDVIISGMLDINMPNKVIDLPCNFKLVEAATTLEAVRLSGNRLHVKRLKVDRNRAASTWDGFFGTQPGVRIGQGDGMRLDYLQIDNSMDEGLSIQLATNLKIGTVALNNCGEHGLYFSGSPREIQIEQVIINGYGMAGYHDTVAAFKLAGASPNRISGLTVLGGTVDDGGATGGVSKFVVENWNSSDVNMRLRVIQCDQVFNINGGADGSYHHTYSLRCDSVRSYVCGAANNGITRKMTLKNCSFPNVPFLKAGMWSRMINCEIPGGMQVDNGHDGNIGGILQFENVNAGQLLISKNLRVLSRGSSFTNVTVNNNATVSLRMDATDVAATANDALNTTAGTTVKMQFSNGAISAPRYGANGPMTLHMNNTTLVGTTANLVNGVVLVSQDSSGVNINGDVTYNMLVDAAATQIWDAPLTSNKSATLSTANVYAGLKFKIVRTANSTGAFSLIVGGGLKNLAVGQWCEVTYTGAAWVLTGFGSL